MYFLKFKLFIFKRKINKIFKYLLIVLALIFIFNEFMLADGYFYREEYIQIWGTLFGAIIGGVLTIWGTQAENSKAIKAEFFRRQKDEILSPLYNELKNIQDVILVKNPYPITVIFDYHIENNIQVPQYEVWGKIKMDTRYIDTPKIVKDKMNELYKTVEMYVIYRETARKAVKTVINDILISEIGTKSKTSNVGDSTVNIVASYTEDESIKLFEGMKILYFPDTVLKNTDEKKIKETYRKIYEESNKLNEMKNLKKCYALWLDQQKQIIELLDALIKEINFKYNS